jgi:hypothetical protein
MLPRLTDPSWIDCPIFPISCALLVLFLLSSGYRFGEEQAGSHQEHLSHCAEEPERLPGHVGQGVFHPRSFSLSSFFLFLFLVVNQCSGNARTTLQTRALNYHACWQLAGHVLRFISHFVAIHAGRDQPCRLRRAHSD